MATAFQIPAAAEIRALRERKSFRCFVERVRPGYIWYRHCELLAAVLQRVADGEIRRLLIFMPPRHGKTELASRLFPAYFLNRYPERYVGLCSYSQDMASSISRAARENYLAGGGSLKPDASQLKQWDVEGGGGFWCAGVGGPITGRGFELGVIDDPVKNAEEAASDLIRAKQQDWYQSTFYTREHPGGASIIIQTRWHELDLSGWLLTEEKTSDAPERWHIVSMPAVAEVDQPEFPSSCTVEPDWRMPGEALCPERYGELKLAQIEERIGRYYFDALFQQRPRAKEGNLFKAHHFITASVSPATGQRVRAWDLAATQGAGDWSVGIRMLRDEAGRYWVEDVVRGQWSPGERDRVIRSTAERDGAACAVWIEEEGGSAGKGQTLALVRLLEGFNVRGKHPTGDKETRAQPFAAQMEVGNVRFLKALWYEVLRDELLGFPMARFDDQVDALSLAFSQLARGQEFFAI